jgi:hypothetical protein
VHDLRNVVADLHMEISLNQSKFAKCISDGLSSHADAELTVQYVKVFADQCDSVGQSIVCRDGEELERDNNAACQYTRDSAE